MQKLSLSHTNPPLVPSQPGQSLDQYKHLKLLPHITEEYDYRITNRLLIEKIRNPRRDKIIIDSLSHTSCSNFWRKRKCQARNQSAHYRRKNTENLQQKKQAVPQWEKSFKEKLARKVRLPRAAQVAHKESVHKENPGIYAQDDIEEKQEWIKRIETQDSYSREALVGRIVKNGFSFFKGKVKNGQQSHNKHSSAAFAERPHIKNQRYVLSQECQSQRPLKRLIRKISPSDFHNKQNSPLC